MKRKPRWRPEEDEVLRQDYVEGGYRAVADRLPGRSRGSIYVRVCELGLSGQRKPGPKACKRISPQLQQRREQFLKDVRKPIADRRSEIRPRPCLCCTNTFLSQGNHNRLCPTCRTGSLTRFDVPHGVGQ